MDERDSSTPNEDCWHIQEFLQVTPGPFSDFLGGAWDEARSEPRSKMLSVTGEFNETLPLSTVAG